MCVCVCEQVGTGANTFRWGNDRGVIYIYIKGHASNAYTHTHTHTHILTLKSHGRDSKIGYSSQGYRERTMADKSTFPLN